MVERGGPRLPGVSADPEEDRIVLHVDMDCFYASCERLREPKLRGDPVVVGMGYEDGESHGAVATASYEAREHGIESAQAISTALERLPRADTAPDGEASDGEATDDEASDGDASDGEAPPGTGHYRPVDMEFYETVSERVMEICRECADILREVSIDEAYLDVTERTAWTHAPDGDRTLAEGFARHVKSRIEREVGVVASVGVAPNMSAAKVASDHDKPDGLVVVEPGEVRDFLAPLDVEDVHGVGPVTARELRDAGIHTAGDLAEADPAALHDHFGERGREFVARARGEDPREVTPVGRPKSLSRESAFTDATAESDKKRERVATLAAAVAERAAEKGALYRTIGIKVVTPPFEINTRAHSLSGPVADADLVEDVALDLLAEFRDSEVRKLGVRVSNLAFDTNDQSNLQGWDAPDADTATGDPSDGDATDGATRQSKSSGGEPDSTRGQRTLDGFEDERE